MQSSLMQNSLETLKAAGTAVIADVFDSLQKTPPILDHCLRPIGPAVVVCWACLHHYRRVREICGWRSSQAGGNRQHAGGRGGGVGEQVCQGRLLLWRFAGERDAGAWMRLRPWSMAACAIQRSGRVRDAGSGALPYAGAGSGALACDGGAGRRYGCGERLKSGCA